jgi:hypothetical protein
MASAEDNNATQAYLPCQCMLRSFCIDTTSSTSVDADIDGLGAMDISARSIGFQAG